MNEIGQRTGLTTSGTAFPNLPSWFWGYDSLGQVTNADSSVATNDRSYQYDSIGNRKKTANSLTLPISDNYTSNALNQYSAIQEGGTGVSPVYDDDGNATAYPFPVAPTANSTLAWDAENRLISSAVGSITTTYAYDALSRRIAIRRSGLQPLSSQGQTTLYLYDARNCIAEYSGSVGVPPSLQKTRLWGLDLSGTLQGAGGVGGLLAESSLITSNPITFYTSYPTYDGNGNVSEYLNSTGQVTAHFEYDPFGNTVVNTDTNNQFAYRFSTKPLDLETRLYYYGYRYYDPATGRWPSRDPIEERGGLNLYNFVKNNGVSGSDMLGLFNCDPCEDQCPCGGSPCEKSKCEEECRNGKLKQKCGPSNEDNGWNNKGSSNGNNNGGGGGVSRLEKRQACFETYNDCMQLLPTIGDAVRDVAVGAALGGVSAGATAGLVTGADTNPISWGAIAGGAIVGGLWGGVIGFANHGLSYNNAINQCQRVRNQCLERIF